MNHKTTFLAAMILCCTLSFIAGRLSMGPDKALPDDPAHHEFGPQTNPRQRHVSDRGFRGRKPEGRNLNELSGNSADKLMGKMDSILRNPRMLDRTNLWLEMIKESNSEECEFLANQFITKGYEQSNYVDYRLLLNRWAELDPHAALNHAKSDQSHGSNASSILSAWADTDPEAAIRWAEENHNPNALNLMGGSADAPNPWLTGVIEGIAAKNLPRAVELMAEIPLSSEKRYVASRLAAIHYEQQGKDKAIQFAKSIEDDMGRHEAINSIAEKLAVSDPYAAADLLLANPTKLQTLRPEIALRLIARTDVQAAISYMEKAENPVEQNTALDVITNELSKTKPKLFLELLDSNPALIEDDSIAGFAYKFGCNDAAIGAETISRIIDPEFRTRTYTTYLQEWLRKDYDGALNWMNQNQIPNEVRQSLENINK